MEKKIFDDIREARDFIKMHQNVHGMEIHGMTNWVYPFINDTWAGQIEYDRSLMVGSNIDIETDSSDGFPNIEEADKAIVSITIKIGDIFYVFGMRPYQPSRNDVHFTFCKDERDLLLKFLSLWQEESPDYITGWNIEFFDIPYIINRVTRVLGEEHAKRFSPWGILQEKTLEWHGKKIVTRVPLGVNVLDYMAMYKKFTAKTLESHRLDDIALIETGEQKLDYSDYETLHALYEGDYQKFIDYNIHDVALVDKIDEATGFIDLAMEIAYDAKVLMVDSLGSVKLWDVIIHNYLMDKGIVVPPEKRASKDSKIAGAFVKEPHVGMHDWIMTFDITSLYPSLIRALNISPETYVGKIDDVGVDECIAGDLGEIHENLVQKNRTVAANGCMYRRDEEGFMPAVTTRGFDRRIAYRKQSGVYFTQGDKVLGKKYDNKQKAEKVKINSLYGVFTNVGFRYFDVDYGESITYTGQVVIKRIQNRINEYLNNILKTNDYDFVVASDTDSALLRLGLLVEKTGYTDKTEILDFLDGIGKNAIGKIIEDEINRISDYFNFFQRVLKMKREIIADKGIWIAKKNYILHVMDDEGTRLENPKMKITGISAVRSTTPNKSRVAIKEAIKLIMTTDNETLLKYIEDFKNGWDDLSIDDIATPTGVKGLDEYNDSVSIYTKGTPIHVKASLLYNDFLKKKKLDKKYPAIYNSDKIKYCYLKMPNPIKNAVIGWPGSLPKELELEKYVDRDEQFHKGFLGAIQKITDPIGWKVERKATLDDFFS